MSYKQTYESILQDIQNQKLDEFQGHQQLSQALLGNPKLYADDQQFEQFIEAVLKYKLYQFIQPQINLRNKFFNTSSAASFAEQKLLETCANTNPYQTLTIHHITSYLPYTKMINESDPGSILIKDDYRKKQVLSIDLIDYNNIATDIVDFFKIKSIDIDADFIRQNIVYLKSLSTKDKYLLASYTKHGDLFVNNFLIYISDPAHQKDRMTSIIKSYKVENYSNDKVLLPLFYALQSRIKIRGKTDYEKFLELFRWFNTVKRDDTFVQLILDCIKEYTTDLIRITNGAPQLTKPMIVYRGVKTIYYESEGEFINNTFMSTTADPSVAVKFADCCVKQIILQPGFRLLFVAPLSLFSQESEFLIGPFQKFNIVQQTFVSLTQPHNIVDFVGCSARSNVSDVKYQTYLDYLKANCKLNLATKQYTLTIMESID